ncbi:MAG: hypothetical protein COC22_01320 [Flavobacteriaceae bacterium]|nr:MAG: hypothetical protein COC22_01320 [Flavobacteriaceae bacterium]
MKKKFSDSQKAILEGEPIIKNVIIHPSIIRGQISKKTRNLVERIAEYNWYYHVDNHAIPTGMAISPELVYRKKGWNGWIDFMGLERMLYEIEEIKRRYGSAKEFILISEKVYTVTNFYEMLELNFLTENFPAVFVIEVDGQTFRQIFGDIDETLTHDQIEFFSNNHKQSNLN